jgi:hypothetical protein
MQTGNGEIPQLEIAFVEMPASSNGLGDEQQVCTAA